MIDRFKKDHWYRFNGKAESAYINDSGEEFVTPQEKFMLDKNWHQCKEESDLYYTGCFYDSSPPNEYCVFGDQTQPKGEDLYMFDEMSPAMYNIKKLKDLKNQLDK